MSEGGPKPGRISCIPCSISIAGLSMTRVILWLVAIAVASFAIGFVILATSGIPFGPDQKISPFKNTAMFTPNTTPIMLDGATQGNLRITMGAGELTLREGAPRNELMEATVFSRAREWQPDFSQNVNNSHKTVTMTDRGHTGKEWVAIHSPNSWDVQISDQVPVSLEVDVGAGDSRLSLGNLNLIALTMNNGAGDTVIDLEGYHGNRFDAELMNGIGDLTLRIPKGSNTRITVHHGVGDIMNSGLVQDNDTYVTAGSNPSLPENRIAIKQGVGSITLTAV
jgi:hypothetical protein